MLCGLPFRTGSNVPSRPETAVMPMTPSATNGAPSQSRGLLDVPVLSSLPFASAKLYLDFDGDVNRRWGAWAGIGGTLTGMIDAFNTDADPLSFSSRELDQIRQVWAIVAEKYSPFNVDVTTIDPGKLQDKKACKVVIGGDGAWHGSGGGVAYVGGFGGGLLDHDNVGYAWVGQANGGDVNVVAAGAAHEAGHMFGLEHRSDFSDPNKPIEYAPGFLMGNGAKGLGVWDDGPRSDTLSWFQGDILVNIGNQDDVATISGSGNGFGFRADEAGSTSGTATAMGLIDPLTQQFAASGVITTPGDVDVFRLDWPGGPLAVMAQVPEKGAMLNAGLELRGSAFNLISSAATINQGETILMGSLGAGTYYAVVSSRGTYPDIGSYTLIAETNQLFDNTLRTATRFGRFGATELIQNTPFEGRGRFNQLVGDSDPEDDYSFVTGPAGGIFTCVLFGLSADADLELVRDYNSDGRVQPNEILFHSANAGTSNEAVPPMFLPADTRFYLRVYRFGGANTNYFLDCFMDESGNSPLGAPLGPRSLDTGGGQSTLYDFVDAGDVDDFYRIDADNVGRMSLILSQLTADADLYLYRDANNNGNLEPGEQVANSTNTGSSSESISNISITPGAYYLQVRSYTSADTNYALDLNTDYAPFDNGTGGLLPSTPLPNVGLLVGEAQVKDFIGFGDDYDVFKLTVPPGWIKVIQTTASAIPHRLELIHDANGNSQADGGEVLASGTDTISYNVPDLSGGGFGLVFLRASVNHAGELQSNGNYTIKVAGGNVFDMNDTISLAGPLAPGGGAGATVGNQLYWSADADAINDTDDFYAFTLTESRQFNASLSASPGARDAGGPSPRLQLIRDADGNGRIDPGERLAGAPTFSSSGRTTLAVNLAPGTYFLRVFVPEPERDQRTHDLSYTLTTTLGAQTDTTPPVVASTLFDADVFPHGLSVQFSEDVSDSLDGGDFSVQRIGDPATRAPAALVYDSAGDTLGVSLGGVLPDGNYRLTIPSGAVTDRAGNALAATFGYDFFVLAGDANRDRTVDITDLGILATNWQQSPKAFSQGDFSYDGTVDITDLGILATNWQQDVPASRPVASSAPIRTPPRATRRLLDELLDTSPTPEDGAA
jgi:hypothetical protein